MQFVGLLCEYRELFQCLATTTMNDVHDLDGVEILISA